MAGLKWDQNKRRDGRMCWVDVQRNGNRPRIIPVNTWVLTDAESWHIASREETPPVPFHLRHMERTLRNDEFVAGGMSSDAVHLSSGG